MKKTFMKRVIPLWLAMILIINGVAVTGLVEYYFLKKAFNEKVAKLVLASDPEALVAEVSKLVIPAEGYTTSLSWGDLGKRLVEVGAIDAEKYKEMFNSSTNGQEELGVLEGEDKKIAINENNSRFIVNTLWALGLANKSKVLDEGPMRTTDGVDAGNFASTGGWTLGSKPAMDIYSSQELIPLTDEQQDLVEKIALNVYRPCCGNHTAFPDCNHGMAALGYIELAVARGLSEEQIYKDLLVFNSFWFPSTYVEMAVFFQKEKGLSWDKVDAKIALSKDYSSAQGAQKIKQLVQDVPGLKSQGGSCGA